MSLAVTFHTTWNAARMQTEAFLPRGAAAMLLTFDADPWPDDGGLPAPLSAALAAGLCACGDVAARWFDETPPPPAARFLPAAPRTPMQHLRDALPLLPKTWPASLAITRDPVCARRFLETGWTMQYQTLLILPPEPATPPQAALTALRTARDWRDFTGLPSIIALCAPAVDGDAILIACATQPGLAATAATLEHACRDAALAVSNA